MIVDKKLRDVKAVQTLQPPDAPAPAKRHLHPRLREHGRGKSRRRSSHITRKRSCRKKSMWTKSTKCRKNSAAIRFIPTPMWSWSRASTFDGGAKKTDSIQARVTNALKPAAETYNKLTADQQVRVPPYHPQVCQMVQLHQPNRASSTKTCTKRICAVLVSGASTAQRPQTDLEVGRPCLPEYYRLEKTYEGSIELEETPQRTEDWHEERRRRRPGTQKPAGRNHREGQRVLQGRIHRGR